MLRRTLVALLASCPLAAAQQPPARRIINNAARFLRLEPAK